MLRAILPIIRLMLHPLKVGISPFHSRILEVSMAGKLTIEEK
jgi:hypothetical protein